MGAALFTRGDIELLAFRSGVASLLGYSPNNILYAGSSNGSALATNVGTSSNAPLTTLALALSKCAAGDCVVLLAGHAETGTSSAIAASAAGVAIVGQGVGASRPTFTAAASANDLIQVTAANVLFKNIRFVGTTASCTALVDVGAAGCTFDGCVFSPAATPVASITWSAGNNLTIINCKFAGTTDGPDFCLDCEAHTTGLEFRNNTVDFGVAGLDNAIIRANADAVTGIVDGIIATGLDLLAIDFNSSTNATGDGVVSNCIFSFRAGITASAGAVPVDVGGWTCVNVRWSDVAAGRDVYTLGTTVT